MLEVSLHPSLHPKIDVSPVCGYRTIALEAMFEIINVRMRYQTVLVAQLLGKWKGRLQGQITCKAIKNCKRSNWMEGRLGNGAKVYSVRCQCCHQMRL